MSVRVEETRSAFSVTTRIFHFSCYSKRDSVVFATFHYDWIRSVRMSKMIKSSPFICVS